MKKTLPFSCKTMAQLTEVSEKAIIMCQGNVNIRIKSRRYRKCNEEDEMNTDTVLINCPNC